MKKDMLTAWRAAPAKRPVSGPGKRARRSTLPWAALPAALVLSLLASDSFVRPARGDVYSRLAHGAGFRNVRTYGAKGDGATDDTAAFIRALDEGRGRTGVKSPANVYVPPGTYLISDTLILWRATLLAGDEECPPTIVLRPSAPGFGDPANPKPMLVTAGGWNVDPATRNWRTRTDELNGSTNNTFFITIRDLDLKIAGGNPGAWGIYWLVAQQTSLRRVAIDAGTAQGCLRSMWWGGGGVISQLRLVGGDYGWHVQETSQWLLRSTEFRGQRKASLWLDQVWNFSLVDLRFDETAPVRLRGGAVALIDSRFAKIAGDSAIESDGTTALFLQNVATQGGRWVVRDVLPAGPGGATRVRRWAAGAAMVNGKALPGRAHDLAGTLPAREEPLPRPPYPRMPRDTLSVTALGAKGDGKTDCTEPLRRALLAHRALFFPEGEYLVSDSLTLRPDSQLFGEMWSLVQLKPTSAGFQDPSGRKPLLDVPGGAQAAVTICHLQCRVLSPGGIACDWQAGGRSAMIDTTFLNDSPTQQLNWRVRGQGGGLIENCWSPGKSGDGLEISSTGPAWFYMVQQEHYQGTALVLRNAKHVVLLGLQFEMSPNYVRIEDCRDITLFQTVAGSYEGPPARSLIHVANSHGIALFNNGITNAQRVITEEPHGWSAGPSSPARTFNFARQEVWVEQ
jgi:hypothetical protein